MAGFKLSAIFSAFRSWCPPFAEFGLEGITVFQLFSNVNLKPFGGNGCQDLSNPTVACSSHAGGAIKNPIFSRVSGGSAAPLQKQ
jgi:hypothetical protein